MIESTKNSYFLPMAFKPYKTPDTNTKPAPKTVQASIQAATGTKPSLEQHKTHNDIIPVSCVYITPQVGCLCIVSNFSCFQL